jgi:hypothetical protein
MGGAPVRWANNNIYTGFSPKLVESTLKAARKAANCSELDQLDFLE